MSRIDGATSLSEGRHLFTIENSARNYHRLSAISGVLLALSVVIFFVIPGLGILLGIPALVLLLLAVLNLRKIPSQHE